MAKELPTTLRLFNLRLTEDSRFSGFCFDNLRNLSPSLVDCDRSFGLRTIQQRQVIDINIYMYMSRYTDVYTVYRQVSRFL